RFLPYTTLFRSAFTEVNRSVERIIVIRQLARHAGYLHILDTVIGEHKPRDFGAGEVTVKVHLRILLKLAFQPRTDHHAAQHKNDGNNHHSSHHHRLFLLIVWFTYYTSYQINKVCAKTGSLPKR